MINNSMDKSEIETTLRFVVGHLLIRDPDGKVFVNQRDTDIEILRRDYPKKTEKKDTDDR